MSLAVPLAYKRSPSPPRREYDVEVQLLVDLYDDQRLAELSSLETVLEDRARSGPRSDNNAARNPGDCLDTCERANWAFNVKPDIQVSMAATVRG